MQPNQRANQQRGHEKGGDSRRYQGNVGDQLCRRAVDLKFDDAFNLLPGRFNRKRPAAPPVLTGIE